MAEYAYVRVSTKEQRLDRQLDALPASIPPENIFQEKESGKNFEDRPVWNRMMGILREGDTLFIKSIDRMGRNYREMGEVWRELTQRMGVHVVVLDMPILDTRGQNQLFQVLIADIVFALFSYVADNERTTIRARQRESIDAAKARGVRFGRKMTPITPQQEATFYAFSQGVGVRGRWAKECGIGTSAWNLRYSYYTDRPEEIPRLREKRDDYEEQLEMYKSRYMTEKGIQYRDTYGHIVEYYPERATEIAKEIDLQWLMDAPDQQELYTRQKKYFPLIPGLRACGLYWTEIAQLLGEESVKSLPQRYRKWALDEDKKKKGSDEFGW